MVLLLIIFKNKKCLSDFFFGKFLILNSQKIQEWKFDTPNQN